MHSRKPEQSFNAVVKKMKRMYVKCLNFLSFINFLPEHIIATYKIAISLHFLSGLLENMWPWHLLYRFPVV